MDKILNSLTFPNLPDRYIIPYDKIWNIFPRKSLPSAPIHAFADGADGIPIKAMSVAVRAVQDLHGYDKPWAGGAGKNKLKNQAISSTQNGITITVYADGSFLVNGTATGLTGFALNAAVPVTSCRKNRIHPRMNGTFSKNVSLALLAISST